MTNYLPTVADDAATINGWTDRYPATIIKRTAKTIVVQEDKAERIGDGNLEFSPGGFAAHAEGQPEWGIVRDIAGRKVTYSLRKNGRWVRKGESATSRDTLTIGRRVKHYDYNF